MLNLSCVEFVHEESFDRHAIMSDRVIFSCTNRIQVS